MALSIKDPETEQLARDLARQTGQSITQATKRALVESLRRARHADAARKAALLDELETIRRRWNELPTLDDRSPEEIIGYDENGLPR